MTNRTPRRKRLLLAAILACGLGMLSIAHTLQTAHGSWADALSDGRPQTQPVDAPVSDPSVMAEGRVSAYADAQLTLSTEMAGRLVNLPVHEGDQVHQGDLIAQLSDDEIQASLREEQGKQREAEVQIQYLQWKVPNVTQQYASHSGSLQEMKETQRDLDSARARLEEASAAIARLQVQLAKTRLVCPIDGTITSRSVTCGEAVQFLSPIVTIVNLQKLRIEAEVNEFDASGVSIGSMATVTAEGYPGVQWKARVQEIPDTIVMRHLRPQDPGRPTDTGILLVKIELLEPCPLRLGQRVEVKLEPQKR